MKFPHSAVKKFLLKYKFLAKTGTLNRLECHLFITVQIQRTQVQIYLLSEPHLFGVAIGSFSPSSGEILREEHNWMVSQESDFGIAGL